MCECVSGGWIVNDGLYGSPSLPLVKTWKACLLWSRCSWCLRSQSSSSVCGFVAMFRSTHALMLSMKWVQVWLMVWHLGGISLHVCMIGQILVWFIAKDGCCCKLWDWRSHDKKRNEQKIHVAYSFRFTMLTLYYTNIWWECTFKLCYMILMMWIFFSSSLGCHTISRDFW